MSGYVSRTVVTYIFVEGHLLKSDLKKINQMEGVAVCK